MQNSKSLSVESLSVYCVIWNIEIHTSQLCEQSDVNIKSRLMVFARGSTTYCFQGSKPSVRFLNDLICNSNKISRRNAVQKFTKHVDLRRVFKGLSTKATVPRANGVRIQAMVNDGRIRSSLIVAFSHQQCTESTYKSLIVLQCNTCVVYSITSLSAQISASKFQNIS